MLTDITLPQLADSMTTAAITAWLKDVGDPVRKGEPIVEVDIDKTTIELEATASGILKEIRILGGTEDVPVGSVLAVIDAVTRNPDVTSQEAAEGNAGSTSDLAESAGSNRSSSPSTESHAPTPSAPASESTVSAVGGGMGAESAAGIQSASPDGRPVDASPLARRMAELLGLDLATVRGTGPGGRIRKVDVDESRGS